MRQESENEDGEEEEAGKKKKMKKKGASNDSENEDEESEDIKDKKKKKKNVLKKQKSFTSSRSTSVESVNRLTLHDEEDEADAKEVIIDFPLAFDSYSEGDHFLNLINIFPILKKYFKR